MFHCFDGAGATHLATAKQLTNWTRDMWKLDGLLVPRVFVWSGRLERFEPGILVHDFEPIGNYGLLGNSP
jgi:hypothetical protein